MSDRYSVGICFMLLILFILAMTPIADMEEIAAHSTTVVSEPENRGMCLAGTPHGPIVIDGDANFFDTAMLEGWPGDGSPVNPFIIDGLDIDLGGGFGHCISISNTRVSFIISSCSLNGAESRPWDESGAGIYLENVTNGELVNNVCNNNTVGIQFRDSTYNTVANNTCSSNNMDGISLGYSNSTTVSDNTCFSNNQYGISLGYSNSTTVSDNTCSSNTLYGISLVYSHRNTVSDNTCNNNSIGIYLRDSNSNIVVNNTCIYNPYADIYLYESDSNIIVRSEEIDSVLLLLIGFVGITLLGAGRWKVSTRGGHDEIIVPIRYRLASWLRMRRSINHVDVDENLEPDSSDQ